MKLLKINVSGFMMLEDEFSIDFLTKAKIMDLDKEEELLEIEENLFMPTTFVFTGKNSSGKTAVLKLISFVLRFLFNGRADYNPMFFRKDIIYLELYFLLEGTIYKYKSELYKPEETIDVDSSKYCYIQNEELYFKKYYKSYGKNIYDDKYIKINHQKNRVLDTSILYEISRHKNFNVYLPTQDILDIQFVFENFEKIAEGDLLVKIINLFDENINDIYYDKEEKLYFLDIIGLGKKSLRINQLDQFLSEGTKKGVIIFALAIMVLKSGGTLIIDEIENSFHKNLVENIILIFNDKRINKNNANLIFSTHYVEILDLIRRRDSIYIMNKKDYITAFNLHLDFDGRSDLLKSNQFNNNTFDTLINYNKLMILKKRLFNEVSDIIRR